MKDTYSWKQFFLEILTILIAVILAFAITNWNDNRKDHLSESKILSEIENGLKRDLEDLRLNIRGHKVGVEACNYFRKIVQNKPVRADSVGRQYHILFRDFISIQNSSGYESLKSKGLEIIENDSLRFEIIDLYDFHYEIIEKIEEQYSEMQFNQTYYNNFNNIMAPYLVFDSDGQLKTIKQPVNLSGEEENILLSYLWRIEFNRNFALDHYLEVEKKVLTLIKEIETELK